MNVIAYYRVSTSKQEKSGLGLSAQKQIVAHYSDKLGYNIISEYEETQSGKGIENRKELHEAIKQSKIDEIPIIVAKLDRLSRDVEHTFKIVKQLGEGKLICCDLPNTDILTLSIFAGLAQKEREIIGIKTRMALKELKKKGIKLGNTSNFSDEGRRKGVEAIKKKARENENNRRAKPLIKAYREQGLSLKNIADKLNQNGFTTARGKQFHKTSVMRLLKHNSGLK